MSWFAVDKEGLAALLDKKGKSFAVLELLQNGWDQEVSQVEVTLEKLPRRPFAKICVEDDDPNGFSDLSHAFTLFGDTYKRYDPTKRGRFNLGEKLVLALCKEATISTTTGTIQFDEDGRHRKRKKREVGSKFEGLVRMNQEEFDETLRVLHTVIPPRDIVTIINGKQLPYRDPIGSFEATLETEIADTEGNMRTSYRQTTVIVYEPVGDEGESVYEMGIPIVTLGDKWDYDVQQKIPLNMERTGINWAFRSDLRMHVLNELHHLLQEDEASDAWVKEGMERSAISDEAVCHIMDLRFGKKRVIFDPSDQEANKLAVSKGYQVIHGKQLSSCEWDSIKRSNAALPAGQVTPSPKPWSDDPNATIAEFIPQEDWTPGMQLIADYSQGLAQRLLDCQITVRFTNIPNNFGACFGRSGQLTFNIRRLGKRWFNKGIHPDVDRLLVHEFGHYYSLDHLSSDYHEALCKLGARMKKIALEEPGFFKKFEKALA